MTETGTRLGTARSFKVGKLKKEIITLTDPTGRVMDKMILPEMRTDVSYGRTLGIAGLFYYDTPTPFQQNRDGFTGYAEKVKDAGARYECHVELYDDSGNNLISQGAAFSLMGDFSLDMPQKSFKFRAKSLYGAKDFCRKTVPGPGVYRIQELRAAEQR